MTVKTSFVINHLLIIIKKNKMKYLLCIETLQDVSTKKEMY